MLVDDSDDEEAEHNANIFNFAPKKPIGTSVETLGDDSFRGILFLEHSSSI